MNYKETALAAYLHTIGQYKLLTADEELELGRRIKDEGDQIAREKLINHNLRLVVSVAKPYRTRGNHNIPLEDLIADGNLGLIAAVEKYDYTLGYRFSTCAVPWIKQAITKGIMEKSRTIRVPAHVVQMFNEYKTAYEELAQTNGGEPTFEDIARKMGITTDKLHEILMWKKNTVSMETPLEDEGEGDTLGDLVADPGDLSPIEYTQKSDEKEFIARLLKDLDPRTKAIFKLRYGLGDENDPEEYRVEHTLEEIGSMLTPAITRERVRQIVAQQLARWKIQYSKDGEALM